MYPPFFSFFFQVFLQSRRVENKEYHDKRKLRSSRKKKKEKRDYWLRSLKDLRVKRIKNRTPCTREKKLRRESRGIILIIFGFTHLSGSLLESA